jgi:hypothetical protein
VTNASMSPQLKRLLIHLLRDDSFHKPKHFDAVTIEAMRLGIFLQHEKCRNCEGIYYIENPDRARELLAKEIKP